MNKITKPNKQVTKNKEKRLLEAKESFRKMQEEISPFVKRRVFKEYSTAGEWCEISNLYS